MVEEGFGAHGDDEFVGVRVGDNKGIQEGDGAEVGRAFEFKDDELAGDVGGGLYFGSAQFERLAVGVFQQR